MVVQGSYSSYICSGSESAFSFAYKCKRSRTRLVKVGDLGDVDRVCARGRERWSSCQRRLARTGGTARGEERRTDDGHVLDLFCGPEERLVVAHAVRVPVVAKADDDDARLFCEDGLVDVPARLESREEVGHGARLGRGSVPGRVEGGEARRRRWRRVRRGGSRLVEAGAGTCWSACKHWRGLLSCAR